MHQHRSGVCGAVFVLPNNPPCGWPEQVTCIACVQVRTAVDLYMKVKYLEAA